MKKSILFIFALMAAMSLSCKKEALTDGSGSENSGNTTGEYAYTIKGTFASEDDAAAGDSKVGIGTKDGNYFGKWEAGDQVVIYETSTKTSTERQLITDGSITVSNISTDGKTADISFNLKSGYGEDTRCRAFYYSDALVGMKYGQGILAAEQVQKGTGLTNTSLKKYAFIYTTNDASVKNKVLNPANNCAFYHALSYVDISFSSEDFKGWNVEKIAMYNESGTSMASTKYEVNCSVYPWPYTETGKSASAISSVYNTKSSRITLSFSDDVILSDKTQDAYLVSLPTHINKEADADSGLPSQAPQKHTIIFQISRDGRTEYAKVRFNTCLKGGCVKKLKVGEIRKDDITNDYKEIYDAGLDIKIGDMVVNKTTFPTASVIAPNKLKDNRSKGLVFIDDEDGTVVENVAAQTYFGSDGPLVVIGRYANIGKQTNIKANSFRNSNNVAFLNVKFTYSDGQTMFERQSTQTARHDLTLVDCYIDATTNTGTTMSAVIRDRSSITKDGVTNIAAPYSKILFDNCVIKMSDESKPFYLLNKPLDGSVTTPRTLELRNSVFFYPTAAKNPYLIIANSNCVDDELTINLVSNTIVNFVSGGAVRVYSVAGLVSDKDLVYASGMSTRPGWDTPKYHYRLGATTNTVGTCSNCYFAWDDMWCIKDEEGKIINECQNWQTYAATNKNNISKKDEGSPFTAADYDLGYFPVDETKVTNGAGASYDTKGYCTWTTE